MDGWIIFEKKEKNGVDSPMTLVFGDVKKLRKFEGYDPS